MVYNQSKLKRTWGFTLIETIMVIAIVVVLAFSGGWLMMHFVRNSVFLSNQLNMDMLAADALNVMIEGDSQAKGLRFSREITAIADTQLNFVNQDSQTIEYRLDTATGQLYRTINGGAEVVMPSYLKAGIKIFGKGGKLFLFYDSNEVLTAVPVQVRWISLILIAQSGTGLFSDWEGSSEQASAVAVTRFQ
jgi:prepilin-type N-terminal cleavage/methylation domain-containing protein